MAPAGLPRDPVERVLACHVPRPSVLGMGRLDMRLERRGFQPDGIEELAYDAVSRRRLTGADLNDPSPETFHRPANSAATNYAVRD
jgi:hypothetical protein